MRVGVFGGSFDPVHLAHLMHAEQCREQAQLDRLLFVPAPRPPHKREGPIAPFMDRVAMLQRAIANNPFFAVDPCEEERTGLSYTVETLRFLHQREPGSQFFLIVGSDSVRDIGSWREPEEIAQLSTLLIIQRPGSESLAPPSYFNYQLIISPLVDISSTTIRHKCSLDQSVRYQVPDLVREYIFEHHLYQAEAVSSQLSAVS